MARGGKKAPRATRGGSRQQTQDNTASTFTLQDEARNTTHGGWDRNTRLRNRPVSFVSGGLVEPLENPAILGEGQIKGELPTQAISTAASPSQHAETVIQEEERSTFLEPSLAADVGSPGGLIQPGTNEALPLKSSQFGSTPAACQSDTHDSDSSDEVILFKGRGTARQDTAAGNLNLREMRREITLVETTLGRDREHNSPLQIPETIPRLSAAQEHLDSSNTDEHYDAIDDYLANVLDHELHYHGEMSSRELGGMGDDFLEEGIDNSRVRTSAALTRGDYQSRQYTRGESRDEAPLVSVTKPPPSILKAARDDDADAMEPQSQHHEEEIDDSEFPPVPEDAFRQYLSANIFAAAPDDFDDFDLMDWTRPSLQRKKRPKNDIPSFNVSDSELEAQLSAAWQGDRLRKMDRKRAREELRAQGMLGKRADPDDLRVKYPAGMNLEEIETEIKAFLLSSESQLILPPMDANARKVVHQLANRLKLKSKSTGSGDQRRPALYRTKQTPKYAAAHVEEVVSRSSRRYFPRLDMKSGGAKRQAGGPGRAHHGGATVRDGEVVGGSAPEIGAANKGRAILEKLGWTHGQALGALDNKGIKQPIEHVVKRSKAGLGGT